jgi:hypothetical protein
MTPQPLPNRVSTPGVNDWVRTAPTDPTESFTAVVYELGDGPNGQFELLLVEASPARWEGLLSYETAAPVADQPPTTTPLQYFSGPTYPDVFSEAVHQMRQGVQHYRI